MNCKYLPTISTFTFSHVEFFMFAFYNFFFSLCLLLCFVTFNHWTCGWWFGWCLTLNLLFSPLSFFHCCDCSQLPFIGFALTVWDKESSGDRWVYFKSSTIFNIDDKEGETKIIHKEFILFWLMNQMVTARFLCQLSTKYKRWLLLWKFRQSVRQKMNNIGSRLPCPALCCTHLYGLNVCMQLWGAL